MNIIALSPAFSKAIWPAALIATIYLGPKLTRVAKSTVRTVSAILGGQRFLAVALPDNFLFVTSCLSLSFASRLTKGMSVNAQLAVSMRFIAYSILGCWLSDQVRLCMSYSSSKYLFFLKPSDRNGFNNPHSVPPVKQKQERKIVPSPVGLTKEIEQKIENLCREFSNSEIRTHYQIAPLCGILLYGPTGTGKTSLAHHLASRLGCKARHYQYLSASSLLDKYVGQSEANVRRIFDNICKNANERIDKKEPIVFVIDEIDSILRSRADCKNFQSGMGTSLVNQFLICMDQIKSLENVLLIGITNYREYLDSAALRAGRFDMHLHLKKPTASQTHEILRHYIHPLRANNMLCENLDERKLEKAVIDMTGAEIEAFVEAAKRSALGKCSSFAKGTSSYRKIDLEDFSIPLNNIAKGKEQPDDIDTVPSKYSSAIPKNSAMPIYDAFDPHPADPIGCEFRGRTFWSSPQDVHFGSGRQKAQVVAKTSDGSAKGMKSHQESNNELAKKAESLDSSSARRIAQSRDQFRNSRENGSPNKVTTWETPRNKNAHFP